MRLRTPEDAVAIRSGYPRWRSGQLLLNSDFAWPEPIEASVWNARIGGYRVLPRWLRQRTGRVLHPGDLRHVGRLIEVLRGSLEVTSGC